MSDRDVLAGVMDALARSGWSPGRRDRHGETTKHLWTEPGCPVVPACRCGESWPCPFVAAWELLDMDAS